MDPTTRETGVLLGTGDVVYKALPTKQNSEFQNLILWGTAAPGRDFDLYVRCNALPTETQWDYRGYTSEVNEFLTWQQPGSCTFPGTWYIAVHSYSGAGWFSLVASPMYTAKFIATRRLFTGVNFNADSGTLTQIRNTLAQASRIFYGMTEGQVLLNRIYVYNNRGSGGGSDCTRCGDVPCAICFKQAGSGCGGFSGLSQINCGPDMFGWPKGIAHELGHLMLGVLDEYASFGNPQCGHTIMGSLWGGTNVNNLCMPFDHNKDGTPGSGASPNGPGWTVLSNSGQVPIIPTTTPDNHDYLGHHFGGFISVIQR